LRRRAAQLLALQAADCRDVPLDDELAQRHADLPVVLPSTAPSILPDWAGAGKFPSGGRAPARPRCLQAMAGPPWRFELERDGVPKEASPALSIPGEPWALDRRGSTA
jgi:hypothetical protein